MKSTKHISCNCGHLRHEHFEGGFCNKCACTWYHPNDKWILKQKNDQYVRSKNKKL